MTSAQIIKFVEKYPCLTGTELSKIIGMNGGSCSSALSKLHSDGVIDRYLGLHSRSKILHAEQDLAFARCGGAWRYIPVGGTIDICTLVGKCYGSSDKKLSFESGQKVVLRYLTIVSLRSAYVQFDMKHQLGIIIGALKPRISTRNYKALCVWVGLYEFPHDADKLYALLTGK